MRTVTDSNPQMTPRRTKLKPIPGGLDGKHSACNAGDLGSEDPLEDQMATHSTIFVWRIPWTEETGRL